MKKLLFLMLTALCVSLVHANIIITGTRVIYPAEQRLVNVELTNKTDIPALMQAWVDDGNEQSSPNSPSAAATPFVVVPAVARMEANAGQTLRITYTGKTPLPQDRESVFYLNVLDIPPKPKYDPNGSNNYLQIALRSRIKLFYRPNLPMSQFEAFQAVQWKQAGNLLVVKNPTPYFVTISLAKVGNTPVKEVGMLAPFSEKTLPVAVKVGQKVAWSAINDYGSNSALETVVK